MNQMKQSTGTSRRGFLKKSLYSAPAIMALGHLTPTMIYGAALSGNLTQSIQSNRAALSGDTTPPSAGAGQRIASGNNANGKTGFSTNGGGGSGPQGGSEGAGGANNGPDVIADGNQEDDKKKKGGKNGKVK